MTNDPMTNDPITNPYLTDFLESLKKDLINSLLTNGKKISAQTAADMVVSWKDGKCARLEIPACLQLLETGRGPTGPNAVAGNPPMIERIRQWCREKGLPEKAAWAIKKAIDKNGFKGVDGLISAPLSPENISLRLNQSLGPMAEEIVKEVGGSLHLK
jgi:hypothetical protein